ncbi:MAG: hypothetical protein ACPGLV_08185 [Bacteroidia bacterium]
MRPQFLLVRTFIVLSLGFLWPMKTHAQKCECTKNHKRLFENPKESWEYGEYKDDRQLTGHPYSTFSKTHAGSYIKGTINAKERLDNLRAMVQQFQKISSEPNSSIREAQNIYPTLYELADKKRIKPDFKVEKKSKYPHNIAYIAKAAAFVYLCDMDPDGNQLEDTVSARFRNTAIYCINQITENDVNSMLNTIGWANLKGAMSTYCQRYSKNLIMYAQAYDYLRAVSDGMMVFNAASSLPQPASTSTYAKTVSMTTYEDFEDQLNWCGLYVQCYAENLYSHAAFPYNTPLYRVDNHASMSATALGLAGIILNDYTHKKSKEGWHPDLWANTAHQVIDRVLYTENINGIVLGQTQKGGIYGYQEGPYYLKWGSENMLPFMLAFKNFHPETEVNRTYANEYLEKKGRTVLSLSAVTSYYGKPLLSYMASEIYNPRTLKINYVDDENILQMYVWATELERPDGTLPTYDDSWDAKPFFDKAILRDSRVFKNYLAKGQSHNLGYETSSLKEFGLNYIEDKSVDLRADLFAAFAEGFYNNLTSKEYKYPITKMESGDLLIRNNTTDNSLVDYSNTENVTYLHVNVENEEQGQFYLGQTEGAHEHNDHFALALSKGSQNLLVDQPYIGFNPSKDIRLGDAVKHNTIIMDEEETPALSGKVTETFLRPNGEKVVRIEGSFNDGKIKVIREIRAFGDNEDEIIIFDRITPEYDAFGNMEEDPANHTFLWSFTGYGDLYSNTFDYDLSNDRLDFQFQLCKDNNSGYSKRLHLAIKEATDIPFNKQLVPVKVAKGPVKNDYKDDPKEPENREDAVNCRIRWKNKSEITVVTVLRIEDCNNPYVPIDYKPLHSLQYKGNGLVKAFDNGTKNFYFISNDTDLVQIQNPLNETDTNKIAKFRGNGLTLTKDTARGNGTICDMGGWFVSASARNSNFLQYDTDTVFTSNKRFEYLQFDYTKKFEYKGLIKTDKANTKVWFYLTDVPWASQSLMKESNGYTYEYDTLIKAIKLTFDEAGIHRFRFAPVDECITSCFFPPIEITNHFEFKTGTKEVLGHNLAIKQANGYLDIDNGSKMKICEDNYLINRDSITIFANAYWRNFEGPGFKADYRTTEDAYYREPYEIGSSAWDEKRKTVRSMIIVEKNAALVLADSSYTQIGNGGTTS